MNPLWIAAFVLVSIVFDICALLFYLYSLEAPEVPLPPHPPSRPGIWFMSHRADAKRRFPFQHMFLRITPRDPKWKISHPEIFQRTDDAGLLFATLGAGPVGGMLTAAFNRPWDHEVAIRFEEAAGDCTADEENVRIEKLIAAVRAYPNNLRFSAFRPINGPGYNCNALMVAFAGKADMLRPGFSKKLFLCVGAENPPLL